MRTDMMSLRDLASSILEKTRTGKLTWRELGANAFVANIDDNSVTINRAGTGFELVFRNSEGKFLEKLDLQSLDYYEVNLQDLHELARRQALNVDQALIDIKRSLDRL
jgi:hypothetical protein